MQKSLQNSIFETDSVLKLRGNVGMLFPPSYTAWGNALSPTDVSGPPAFPLLKIVKCIEERSLAIVQMGDDLN